MTFKFFFVSNYSELQNIGIAELQDSNESKVKLWEMTKINVSAVFIVSVVELTEK